MEYGFSTAFYNRLLLIRMSGLKQIFAQLNIATKHKNTIDLAYMVMEIQEDCDNFMSL